MTLRFVLFLLIAHHTIEAEPDKNYLYYYRQLQISLLKEYDSFYRPFNDLQKPLNVSIATFFSRIMDVDISTEEVNMDIWIYLEWRDQNLVWKPKDYGGIHSLEFSPGEIWTPELALSSYFLGDDRHYSSRLSAEHTGEVSWARNMVLARRCDMDLSNFPLDKHICRIFFYVKRTDAEWVRIVKNENPDFSLAQTGQVFSKMNPAFDGRIVSSSIHNGAINETKYSVAGITIEIIRKSSPYMYTVAVPYLVANIFMVYSLFLNAKSNIRLVLAFFALYIDLYLLSYCWYTIGRPVASDTPYAVKCITINIIMVISITIICIMNDQFFLRNENPCPLWLKALVDNNLVKKGLFFKLSIKEFGDLDSEVGTGKKLGIEPSPSDWALLSLLVDRICLILFIGIVAIYHS